MKISLRTAFIIAALITSVLGTLAHFAYDWSGGVRLVGLFTAVNESTWEHMKLLFFPMLLVSFLLSQRAKDEYPCILPTLLAGTLIGTFLIPVLFYTYSGILGKSIDFINIAIYYICVIAAYYSAYKIVQKECNEKQTNLLLFITFVLVLMFFIFTYYPPDLGIFVSPV